MEIRALVFDLDGTLAPAKDRPTDRMAELFVKLLDYYRVGIISGASFDQFTQKFLSHLRGINERLYSRMLLLPTTGAVIYARRNGRWHIVEENFIPEAERKKIIEVLDQTIGESGIARDASFVNQIDDRKSQVTFSGCGQKATEEQREKFDPDGILRNKMRDLLVKKLPDYDVRVAGSTSIDITKKNLNKATAMKRIIDLWDLRKSEVLFIGDAIFPGGNDYSVLEAGLIAKFVPNEIETESWLENLLLSHHKS
jgi:HAD superfamily hydrolase (TIGR01484 family)